METFKCILVDDERPALKLIQAYVNKLPHLESVATCESAEEAIAALQVHSPDILFLDIQMPGLTGIELLQSLKVKPQVIMTTAYREYATKGFDLNVTDYLIKPFSFERFIQAVDKAIEQINYKRNNNPSSNSNNQETTASTTDDHFYVRTNYKLEKVIFSEIRYIESMREYVSLHTDKRRYVVNQSMTKMEGKLPSEIFIRVHRSHIINLSHIDSINGNVIEIGDKKINVGGSYRQAFFDRIKTL